MADGLLNKASIILTPTGYKAGTLYNVAPVVEPYEDFDFARASVASRVNSSGLVEMVGRTLGSELVQNGDFSELGSELVPSIVTTEDNNGGVINYISSNIYSSTSDGTSTSIIRPRFNFNTESGKTYKLVITPTGTITGTVNFKFFDGSSYLFQNYDFTTTKEIYFTDNGNVFGAFDGQQTYSIASFTISVKQIDPNSDWALGTGWSIEDGKLKSDGTINSSCVQDNIFDNAGNLYEINIDISVSSGSLDSRIRMSGSGVSSITISNISSGGSYKFYAIAVSGRQSINIVTLSGNTAVYEIDNVSVKEVIDTNNIPRISYDSNGDNGHILLEPTSTNLITYSEDFSQWTTSNFSANSETTTAPNGDTVNGYDFGDGFIFINTANLDGSSSYTNTIYIKANKSATIGMRKGGAGSDPDNDSINLTTDWQRFEATSVATITTNGRLLLDNRAASGYGVADLEVFIWGAQQEKLSYSTSYIPTLTGSTVTRATETATGAGSADLINSTEGVLYAEIEVPQNYGSNLNIAISDGTTSNLVKFLFLTSGSIRAEIIGSGNTRSAQTTFVYGDYIKAAFSYNSTQCKFFVNGSQVSTTITTHTLPSALNTLEFARGDDSVNFYGKCKALAVFNEALSDSELTQLTT